MHVWGLTGGIASGKSTVAAMLAALGVPVVDADGLYHALIAPQDGHPSPLAHQIAQAFGEGLLTPEGRLDRKALGAQVFADSARRAQLEAITHPAIQEACAEAFSAHARQGHPLAVYDVPLLFERHLEARFRPTIVVWVPAALQRARLMARDGASEAEVMARLEAQLPLDEKRNAADFVIDNSGLLVDTQRQVEYVAQQMRQDPRGQLSTAQKSVRT